MSLTVTLVPGYTFPDGAAIDLAVLRLAASPTILIVGAVGTADLSAGAVSPAKVSPGAYWYGVDAQANDSYIVSLTPAATTLTDGLIVRFKAATTNTDACTLNLNGLGAKPIRKSVLIDLASGEIRAGQIVEVAYDATLEIWQLMSVTSYHVPELFQGATAYMAGIAGLVPAPNAGEQTRVLQADGTWINLDTRISAVINAAASSAASEHYKFTHFI